MCNMKQQTDTQIDEDEDEDDEMMMSMMKGARLRAFLLMGCHFRFFSQTNKQQQLN